MVGERLRGVPFKCPRINRHGAMPDDAHVDDTFQIVCVHSGYSAPSSALSGFLALPEFTQELGMRRKCARLGIDPIQPRVE